MYSATCTFTVRYFLRKDYRSFGLYFCLRCITALLKIVKPYVFSKHINIKTINMTVIDRLFDLTSLSWVILRFIFINRVLYFCFKFRHVTDKYQI